MNEFTLPQAQADMRRGYLGGAPGVIVSGAVWLTAGVIATFYPGRAAVWALLLGGAVIFPLSTVLAKVLGHPGRHTSGNPLGGLAMEGTFWLLAGIAVAYGLQVLRLEWFFPAMLLLIGGRYLTFQTIYGVRLYWALGATLGVAGLALALARAPVPLSAFSGAAIELGFAACSSSRQNASWAIRATCVIGSNCPFAAHPPRHAPDPKPAVGRTQWLLYRPPGSHPAELAGGRCG